MSTTATTVEDLGKAIKNDYDTIIIEGDLAKKVIRIKATGKVAWVVAFGSLVVVIVALIATGSSGGTSTPATVPAMLISAPGAVGVLGVGSSIAAVSIAVAAGSVRALTKLRKGYALTKHGNQVVLTKKQ